MIIKTIMYFENYSEGALKQIVEQAVGRPFVDENGKQKGTIVKATRVDGTKHVDFEIDTEAI